MKFYCRDHGFTSFDISLISLIEMFNTYPMLYITAEKHEVLYTNKSINDRVTHNEILFNVEMRNLSFLPLRLLYYLIDRCSQCRN